MTSDTPHNDDSDAGDAWGTPPDLVKPILSTFPGGRADLDPASGAEPTPYADDRITKDDDPDGLAAPWYGHVWLNPPYGRTENPTWADKVAHEVTRPQVDSLTALVPAATGTRWFGDCYATADALTLIHERITFVDEDGVADDDLSASFGNVIATWGDVPADYWDALADVPYDTTTFFSD